MLSRFLCLCSAYGRLCLILGLLGGLLLPQLAAVLQPLLPQMVAILLTITALRIGHTAALGAVGDLRWGPGSVLALQLGVPLVLYGVLTLVGWADTPFALAAVLATSAPAITGAVNLALLIRLDGGRMMQILVLGTAAFPLTVLPLLMLMPQLGGFGAVLGATLTLLIVIAAAVGLGFWLRVRFYPDPTAQDIQTLDGASVLAFSIIVVGLMAPLNAAIQTDLALVLQWTALAFAISYGLQFGVLIALRRSALRFVAGPLAIGAGNRNVALYLVALPADVVAPLLIFIACWQLPMYLTPILLPHLYKRVLRDG